MDSPQTQLSFRPEWGKYLVPTAAPTPGIRNALSHPGLPQAFLASWPLASCSSPSAAISTTSSTRLSGSAASGTMCCECRAGGWGAAAPGAGARTEMCPKYKILAPQQGFARSLPPMAGETAHLAPGAQDVICSVICKHGRQLSQPGSTLPSSLHEPPSGWCVCNGKALSCVGFSDDPVLAALILMYSPRAY